MRLIVAVRKSIYFPQVTQSWWRKFRAEQYWVGSLFHDRRHQRILSDIEQRATQASEQLLPLVYDEP